MVSISSISTVNLNQYCISSFRRCQHLIVVSTVENCFQLMEIGFDDHLDMLCCSHSHVVVRESFQAHATTKFDRFFIIKCRHSLDLQLYEIEWQNKNCVASKNKLSRRQATICRSLDIMVMRPSRIIV